MSAPEYLICPITREIFYDPVITCDGHTYERYAIEEWLACNSTSPNTGMVLSDKTLIPNLLIKKAREDLHSKEVSDNINIVINDAIEFYRNINNDEAKCKLSFILMRGIGNIKKNEEESLKLAQDSIKYPRSMNILSYFYNNGIVVEQDKDKAIEYFKIAADMGDKSAQYNYGMVMNDVDYLLKSAEQGFSLAYKMIGLYYSESNHKEAIKWLEMYLQENSYDIESKSSLGILLYKNGDYERGLSYIVDAAEMNDPMALHNLGVMYFDTNRVKAINYLKAAVENDFIDSMIILSDMYHTDGNLIDYEKMLLKMYSLGDIPSAFYLAQLYMYQMIDYEKAFKYATKAVEDSNNINTNVAHHILGLLYLTSTYYDKEKAISSFKLSGNGMDIVKRISCNRKFTLYRTDIGYEIRNMN